MSDNIKQESVESLQTKEQEQQAGSNKRTLEAENDKAAKKTFKEKKKKERKEKRPRLSWKKTWQMKMKHRKMKHRKQRKSHFPGSLQR